MRPLLLAVSAVLLLSTAVDGQEPTDASIPGENLVRPADVVAARVREVLYADGDRQSLEALAAAIPELAADGQADTETTFQAAQIAKELALPAPSEEATMSIPTVVPGPEPWMDAEPAGNAWTLARVLENARQVNVETLFRIVAALTALSVLIVLMRRRGESRPRRRRSARPVGEARALVAEGLPLHEVTRRTGIARDALALLAHQRPS